MEQLFQDLERLLEIEALTADLENSCRELEEDIEYEKGELNYAKVQLLSLDSPDFFLRLMPARLEKKKELAQANVRAHAAALEEAKRTLETKRYSHAELKAEHQALLPRREEYAAGKGSYPVELEQHLACVEAIQISGKILYYLDNAKNHFRSNSSDEDVFRGNRQLEYLSKAAQDAHLLRGLLEQIPNPIYLKASYLSWPDHYITEPTSVYAQMDRQNMAVDTVRDVRRQLREHL